MALLLEHTNSPTRASMQKSLDQSMAKRSAGMVTWPSKPKTSRPQNSPILSKSVTDSTDHWFMSDIVLLTMPNWLKLITIRLRIACAMQVRPTAVDSRNFSIIGMLLKIVFSPDNKSAPSETTSLLIN